MILIARLKKDGKVKGLIPHLVEAGDSILLLRMILFFLGTRLGESVKHEVNLMFFEQL